MTNGYQKSVQALIKKIQVVAIIVAVIIVAGVVFTSIHKEEIPEGQIEKQEEQPEKQKEQPEGQSEERLEEQVEEEVSPSVKIESASATFKERDFLYPNQYLCRVKMSGTATLREGTDLSFTGCFDDDIGDDQTCRREIADEDIANIIGSNLTCPSWTQHYGYSGCDRLSGQPATGEWSLTFGDWFYPWRGYKRTFFVKTTTKTDWIWDSVTLTCQP